MATPVTYLLPNAGVAAAQRDRGTQPCMPCVSTPQIREDHVADRKRYYAERLVDDVPAKLFKRKRSTIRPLFPLSGENALIFARQAQAPQLEQLEAERL